MRIKHITQLATILLGAVALTAVAGGGEKSGEKLTQDQQKLMSELDTNADGRISQSEAEAHPVLTQRFRELDRNADMQLEKAEFARFEIVEEETDY